MSFTTFAFFGFLALLLLLYWLLPQRGRRLLLLAASYVFYMWSAPALGAVLLASTLLSYAAGRLIGRGGARRVWVLAAACLLQFGLLFVCKYLQTALDLAHRFFPRLLGPVELDLILPAGVSFFSFAITGYLFDVYRGKLAAEKNLLDYAVFVAFFPCILAGPINQARSFLPQLKQPVRFSAERVKAGLMRFVFGMLQKLVLADNIGTLVNAAYGGKAITPLTWIAVLLLYSLQIYFDFSGYSHMAIGVATAFGLRVPENFNAPYYSASVTSFWKKWHMSLTSWFREYLYFPLGGSRKGRARTYLNILIVFAVSGLWHGAAPHYLLWGLLNGFLQVLERMLAAPRARLEGHIRRPVSRALWTLFCGGVTYCLISVTWLLFRAEGLSQLRYVLGQLFGIFKTGPGGLQLRELGLEPLLRNVLLLCGLACAVVDALWQRGYRMKRLTGSILPYYALMSVMILTVAVFGVYGKGFDPQDFVYFRY